MTKFLEKISDHVIQVSVAEDIGIYITNGHAYTIGINKDYENITKLCSEQVLGHHMKELEENGVLDRSATLLTLKYKKEITIEQKILCTGKKVLVTSSPVFNEEGNIVLVASVVSPWFNRRAFIAPITVGNDFSSAVEGVIGNSEAMQEVLLRATRAAAVDSTVLISGESGVGKEVVARVIHQLSNRKSKPFITVDLATIPEELFESELFGYRGGAFTGTLRFGKSGLVQAAAGGTLFLDEISEIPINVQVKLLRLIQEKEVLSVGSVSRENVNVRFIAATNRDIWALVKSGHFREDLYYRLNVIPIYVPPLRKRKEDICDLAKYFLMILCKRYKVRKYFTPSALKSLMNYNWPGNIREIQNLVERLVVLTPQVKIDEKSICEELETTSLTVDAEAAAGYQYGLKRAMDEFEMNLVRSALKQHGDNLGEAAKSLKIHRTTLLRKLHRYNKPGSRANS